MVKKIKRFIVFCLFSMFFSLLSKTHDRGETKGINSANAYVPYTGNGGQITDLGPKCKCKQCGEVKCCENETCCDGTCCNQDETCCDGSCCAGECRDGECYT